MPALKAPASELLSEKARSDPFPLSETQLKAPPYRPNSSSAPVTALRWQTPWVLLVDRGTCMPIPADPATAVAGLAARAQGH